MDVRPGYKQTEIGVIPEDWDAVPLGSIGESLIGLTYAPAEVRNSGILVLRSSNIQNDELSFEDNVFVKKDVPSKIMVRAGDVLICVRNGSADLIGKSALLDKRTDGMTFGAFMAVYRSDIGVLVNFLFQSSILKRQINEHLGATINQITNKSLNSFRIPLARDPRERNAIADALCGIDDKIRSMVQLIAKKRDVRTGAIQRLLSGEFRFAETDPTKKRFQDTEIGKFPFGWKIEHLGKIVQKGRGIRYGIVQPGEFDRSGRYMIRGQDYSKSKGWATPDKLFRVSPAIEERYRNARVKAGDLIMTIVGYCGHVEIVPDWLDGANLTQTTARLAIGDQAVPEFIKAVLNSPIGEQQVNSFLKGAAQPGLNCSDVEKFLVPLPSIVEQQQIAALMSDMDNEILALEASLEKTRALKQGMMQALLTGRVRLPVQAEALDALEVADA
jgi:type I restriction enzyme, S subunit